MKKEISSSAPLFTGAQLRRLIIPLILEQLFAVTIGMADTVMVAGCGEAAVSGISVVDSINVLFITVFSALDTGIHKPDPIQYRQFRFPLEADSKVHGHQSIQPGNRCRTSTPRLSIPSPSNTGAPTCRTISSTAGHTTSG